MPQVILKERTAHLAIYTFLQEMLINIKTHHFHSPINHQEHLFHRTFITSYFSPVNIAKFLRTDFLQSTTRRSRFADVLQNRCSQKFRKLHREALVLESLFLKKLAGSRPATLLNKDSNKGVFLLQNTFGDCLFF